ncbi:class I SAM-dependent methyltransferase [Pleurocapsa sp. PCC 7319]|uniref:class I SAM-dependent methyltransferase n=1 Tax=Pleurocapsa sp. PCC 7319 TaxID=118161 RepID=UPI00034A7288|nr:class I SAM-dependent methyltransferase [Pleurocapsa sp. PCC 7319]
MEKLQELLKNPPLIHEEAPGKLTSWQLSDEVLYFINNNINEDSITLETGTGISTILFAIKSSHHTCICPSEKQVDRIKSYCQRHQINTDKIDFKIDFSEKVLPSLNINKMDLVLIDGSHAFPIPFIDWYYTYQKLKVGGKIIIDDTQLWTGLVLKQFLNLEPEWKLNKNSPPRSAIFTKIQKYAQAKWYAQQPYIVKNSYFLIFKAKVQNFLRLLYVGDFHKLGKLIGNQLNQLKIRQNKI